MSLTKNREGIAIGLGIALALAIVAFAVLARYSSNAVSMNTLYEKQLEKKRVVEQIRIHLLKSVTMEKNAVMALTDQESEDFANQSRAASAEVNQSLARLGAIVDGVAMPEEKKLVDDFAACWTELGKIDQVVLQLAVENTNLKAANLSRDKGGGAVRRFEQALDEIRPLFADTPVEPKAMALLAKAQVAALKALNLHGEHIAEADEAKMEQIEQRIRAQETDADQALAALAELVGPEGTDALARARAAWTGLTETTAQVVQLSRQNSNIKSLELSLGRKRKIAAQCDDILAAMQESSQNKTLKATR